MFIIKIKFTLAACVFVTLIVALAQIIPVSVEVDGEAYRVNALELVLYQVVMGLAALLIGLLADWYINKLKKQAMAESQEIYRATVWASHHVLNNFLNKLYLIQHWGNQNGKFTEEMSDSMGNMIQEAAGQLLELSRVEPITADEIRQAVSPK